MENSRITQARTDTGMSAKELAEKLGVDISTVNNWESGRRQLTLDRLLQLADVLHVSVTFLLGLDERISLTEPVSAAELPLLHRSPVWMRSYGWALINAIEKTLVFTDKTEIFLSEIQEPIYIIPPAFTLSLNGRGEPLSVDEVLEKDRIWVEPITTDSELAGELRGWYRLHNRRLVENEYGNRFYIDTYGAKWLAYEDCQTCHRV